MQTPWSKLCGPFSCKKRFFGKIYIIKFRIHIWKFYLTFLPVSSLKSLNDIFWHVVSIFYSSLFTWDTILPFFFFFNLKVIFTFKLFIVTVNLKYDNCRCREQLLWYIQKESLLERRVWHRLIPSALVTNLDCFLVYSN